MRRDQTTRQITAEHSKPLLSSIVVDRTGKLTYAQPPFKQIVKRMLKDFPIMCWYMLMGMMTLFGRSLWAITHRALTVTHRIDLLIYVFLMLVSFMVVAGLIGGSFYFARAKLKKLVG